MQRRLLWTLLKQQAGEANVTDEQAVKIATEAVSEEVAFQAATESVYK